MQQNKLDSFAEKKIKTTESTDGSISLGEETTRDGPVTGFYKQRQHFQMILMICVSVFEHVS